MSEWWAALLLQVALTVQSISLGVECDQAADHKRVVGKDIRQGSKLTLDRFILEYV